MPEPECLGSLTTAELLRFYTRNGLTGHVFAYTGKRYGTYGRYPNGSWYNHRRLESPL